MTLLLKNDLLALVDGVGAYPERSQRMGEHWQIISVLPVKAGVTSGDVLIR